MKKYLIFLIVIFSHLSVYANGIKLADYSQLSCSNTYVFCQDCDRNRLLFPLKNFSKNNDAIEVEADNSEITENNEYLITGNVSIRSKDNFLSADKITISKTNESSYASGSAKFQDNDFLLSGDNIFVNRSDSGELIINVSDAKFQEINTKANGLAKTINKIDNISIFENSSYSFCPISKNTWSINADEIKINSKNNRAIATKAQFIFYDFPILYLPKYSWITQGRGSGFLTPSFNLYKEAGETSMEFQSRLPYYYNIAPDRDLLTAISYLSSRGAIVEGKYRQLIGNKTKDDGLFQIESQFLLNDKITSNARWLLNSSIELEVTNNIHLSMLYHRVSDENYFKEIARSGTSQDRLESNLKFQFNNPPLPERKNSGKLDERKVETVNHNRNKLDATSNTNQFSLNIFTENEQLVNGGSHEYVKSLETSIFSRSINKSNPSIVSDIGFISSIFDHDTAGKVTGTRNHAEFSLSNNIGALKPFKSSNLSNNLKLGLTNYSLKGKSNENRVYGSFDLDLSFPFSKSTTFLGNKVTRRIKPTISYDFTTKKKQSGIPLFDTSDTINDLLTYGSLLSGERYDGIDRFVNENDITLSLQTSYIDSKRPFNKRLEIKLAQRYYGDDETVSVSNTENFEKRRRYSDIAASIDFSLDDFNRLTAGIDLQYDPKLAEIEKNNLNITYRLHPRMFISAKHSDDGSSRSLNISGAYPINNRLHLFAGLDKSLSTGRVNKQTSGIAYEDCCWSARIAHFKESLDSNIASYDYSTGFELIFKGLGSTDSTIRDHLRSNIPEYKVDLSENYNLYDDK